MVLIYLILATVVLSMVSLEIKISNSTKQFQKYGNGNQIGGVRSLVDPTFVKLVSYGFAE